MALSWETLRAIPRLLTYADASKREAETKPIRGREPQVKPLGRRSQPHIFIKREENGDIVLGEWHGDLIRYRENGDVVIYDPSYYSKAGPNEITTEVTGIPVHTFDSKAWVRTKEGEHPLRAHRQRIWVPGEGWEDNPDKGVENIFRRVENAPGSGYMQWSYVNPPANVVHHIRRKEMGQVMKTYANFVTWVTAMDSLREGRIPAVKDYVELFGLKPDGIGSGGEPYYYHSNRALPPAVKSGDFTHAHAAELCGLMTSSDATDKYKAYLWLYSRIFRGDTNSADRAKRVIIMHHHREVLKQSEAVGAAKDRYAWAIPKRQVV